MTVLKLFDSAQARRNNEVMPPISFSNNKPTKGA